MPNLRFTKIIVGMLTAGAAVAAAVAMMEAAVVAQTDGGFSDIGSSPYKEAILYVQAQGIVEGYSDGTYRPDNKINRAEFTKILVGSAFPEEISAYSPSSCFSDVPANTWFAKYVCLAKDKGVIGGYPDGTFGPDRNINVAESLKITLEAVYGANIPSAEGAWYQKYVDYAVSNGFMLDAWGDPGKEITRGEMAEFIYKISIGPLMPCIDIINEQEAYCSQFDNWALDVQLSYTEPGSNEETLMVDDYSEWSGNSCSSDMASSEYPREVKTESFDAQLSGDGALEQVVCQVTCHAWTCPVAPPAGTIDFSITSASCQLTKDVGGADNEYTVSVTGTASGPVSARLVMPGLSGYISQSWSSSWDDKTSKIVDRQSGDPETTSWSSTQVVGAGTKTLEGYVRSGETTVSDSQVVTCQ